MQPHLPFSSAGNEFAAVVHLGGERPHAENILGMTTFKCHSLLRLGYSKRDAFCAIPPKRALINVYVGIVTPRQYATPVAGPGHCVYTPIMASEKSLQVEVRECPTEQGGKVPVIWAYTALREVRQGSIGGF